jgi:hypothetical protein
MYVQEIATFLCIRSVHRTKATNKCKKHSHGRDSLPVDKYAEK